MQFSSFFGLFRMPLKAPVVLDDSAARHLRDPSALGRMDKRGDRVDVFQADPAEPTAAEAKPIVKHGVKIAS